MRVNSVNFTMLKGKNTAFMANNVKDEVVGAFPPGVKVSQGEKNKNVWLVDFPRNKPLSGSVAGTFVDDRTVIAYLITDDGGFRRLNFPRVNDVVNYLRIETKEVALRVAGILREAV